MCSEAQFHVQQLLQQIAQEGVLVGRDLQWTVLEGVGLVDLYKVLGR